MESDFRVIGQSRARSNSMAATIRFGKDGRITFNTRAVELLNLDAGCYVAFYQRKDNPSEVYVSKVHEHPDALRLYRRHRKPLAVSCMSVQKELCKLYDVEDNFRVQLSTEKTDMGYLLLSKSVFQFK